MEVYPATQGVVANWGVGYTHPREGEVWPPPRPKRGRALPLQQGHSWKCKLVRGSRPYTVHHRPLPAIWALHRCVHMCHVQAGQAGAHHSKTIERQDAPHNRGGACAGAELEASLQAPEASAEVRWRTA